MKGQFECKKENVLNDYEDEKYKVGQIWNYKTRQGEENSKLTILKVEKYNEKEIIIHISINGLKIKNELRENSIRQHIEHLPIIKDSLNESVTTLVSEINELSNFKEGYQIWKEAFLNNKGGIFTIRVNEVVNFVEETMQSGEKV